MALADSATVLTFMGTTYAASSAADKALADMLVPIACTLVKEEVGFEIEFGTLIEYHPEAYVAPIEDELVEGWEVIGGRAVPRGPRGQKARAVVGLRNLPVREITSVYEAPAAWDTYPPDWPGGTLLTEGQHYRVDYETESFPGLDVAYPRLSWTGHLIRRVGIWSPVGRCTKVTYKAGFSDVELAGRWSVFRLAAIQAATFMIKDAKLASIRGGNTGVITAETIDGWSQTFAPPLQMMQLGLQYGLPSAVKRLLEPYVRMSKFM